jgi:hypothetical protein
VPTKWTFEETAPHGWATEAPSATQPNAGGALRISTVRAHGGTHSLATDALVDYDQMRFILSIEQTFCGSQGLDLGGKTISAWVYFDGPQLSASCCPVFPYVYVTGTGDASAYSPNDVSMKPATQAATGQWLKVSGVMPTDLNHFVYKLFFESNLNSDGWSGTVYIDDISLE